MKISIAMFASAALAAASLTSVASAAAAPAARMAGAGSGGGPTSLCAGLGTSARAICSLCDASRSGRLYRACCWQRRVFEVCADAVAAADAAAAAAAPPPSQQRYVVGGIQLPPLPSGDGVEAGPKYATAVRADKRYGRMGFGRAATLPPPPRGPRGNSHQSAKRADDEAASSWSIERSDVEAAAAAAAEPWYDESDESDESYYYDYRDEAGAGGAGDDDDRSDVEAAEGVGYDQLGDSLLDFLGGGNNEKRFGSLGMRGGR